MSRFAKALEKIRRNPKAVRFDELDAILMRLGFAKRQRGRHATYSRSGRMMTIPHPHGQPFVLPIYVRHVLALLDDIEAEDGELSDEG